MGMLQTLSGEIERLAEKTSRSVVSVSSGHGNGSGVAWNKNTVVTASHVARGADEVGIVTDDGRKLNAKVTGRFRRSDITVLTVDGALQPIEQGDSDKLKAGQLVLAFANPFGSRSSVTSGMITAANRSIGGWWGMIIENAVITDARVNPGYSGGPLVDASGKMVGMNVAYFNKRGIAVPVNAISRVVERIAKGQPFKRAYLGIVSNPVSLPDEVAGDKRVGQDAGVMVYSVEDGTPAKKSGLAFGDVILRFGGKSISSSEDLTTLLGEEAIGRQTKVTVLRGGNVVDLDITPTSGKEE